MQDMNIDSFTSRLDDTLPVIKEVSAHFQNPVRIHFDSFIILTIPHYKLNLFPMLIYLLHLSFKLTFVHRYSSGSRM